MVIQLFNYTLMMLYIQFLKKLLLLFCFAISLTFTLPAQQQFVHQLSSDFNRYQANNYHEKIFAHVDKSFYLTGETIWFKLYAIDGILNQPASLSKVTYVDLINSNNEAVLQASIGMSKSTGNGYFILPNTLQSGIYTIRAYTNWMKNSSPDYFFQQQINIVNTLKNQQLVIPTNAIQYDVQFFAEGGYLVENCQTTLAFKCSNQYAQPIEGKGYILNKNNDTVQKFSTLKYGMGSCTFTPLTNEKYTAALKFKDSVVKLALPNILAQGYTMQVTQLDSNYLQILIQSTNKTIETLYLLSHTRGVINNLAEQYLVNGKALFIVSKKSLREGITHFTIFNGIKKPLCERLYFTQPTNQLNISTLGTNTSYGTKSAIEMNIESTNNKGDVVPSNLSIAVYQIDELQTAEYLPIQAYLYLTADLKGSIINPGYYFEKNDSTVLQAADNLMLTQGWSQFEWDDILTNTSTTKDYLPEIEGQLLQGKLTDIHTKKPAAAINVYATIPNKNFIFKQSKSNAGGNFYINLPSIYGNTDLIIQTNYLIDSNQAIDFENAFSNKFTSLKKQHLYIPKKWAYLLNNKSIYVQAQNTFVEPVLIDTSKNTFTDTSQFFGTPDKKFLLDDFTRFITMEEVIKEYILDIKIKQQKNKFNWRLYNKKSEVFFDNDPLILLDGLPIFNTNTLMEFSPLKIKSIDLVMQRYILQEFVNEGIISLKTYDGDLANYPIHSSAIAFTFNGLQKPKAFYSPKYDVPNDRWFDARNVLLWMPDINTDSNNKIKFYTSNLKGKFIVVIQGITKDGLVGSHSQFFNVQ